MIRIRSHICRLRIVLTSMVFLATAAACAADGLVVANHIALFEKPPQHVPTQGMVDGPLLGNGDVGVVLAGPPEAQRFHFGKNDFWRRNDASIVAVGSVSLDAPALAEASYHQEQDMARAEVRGTFSKDLLSVGTRSWVSAEENLLVTLLRCEGSTPVAFVVRQAVGPDVGRMVRLADNGQPVNVGREQFRGGRWYFDGSIEDLRIESRAFSTEEIREVIKQRKIGPAPKRFDGRRAFDELAVPRMDKALTVAAWIRIEGVDKEANYIVSKGEWNQGYSLGLSGGRLRWAIGGAYVQTEKPLAEHQWVHVAGVFESQRGLELYVDGALTAGTGRLAGGTVEEATATSWFTRRADAMTGSREVAMVTRVLGANVRAAGTDGLQFTLKPGESATMVSVVRSDLDDKEFLASARKRAAQLTLSEVDAISSRHLAWWSKFWQKSFIEIPDKQIERHWYAGLYVMASCSREGKVAPGLWGNWITTDRPAWHGDFHLNYNFQAPYYPVYSSNHAELSLPFYQAIWQSVPNGRSMAARHGWKGVHFPVSIGPWGLSPENPDGDWGQRSDAAFAALNFIWYYQYTQDADFLRTTAYPYLLEVAAFWEDYLKFENGRYVIYRDSIHEGSGPDMNPLLSLGLLRTLFRNLASMSEDLNVDEQRRPRWRHICEHLSEYPLQERNGKTVFRYSEKGMAWCGSNTLGIHHIFPAGAIGLDSDPRLLETCRNTIDAMARWHDGNGFSSWYTACVRVGYDPKTILARLRAECDRQSYPNLVLQYGGGGIENVAGFLAINEMLLQSHEGVIRLFPVWPKDLDARFGGLRAVGAFLMGAEMKDGVIRGVTIRSEKERDCTVQNPWPGRSIRLVRNTKPAEIASGSRITFKTTAGEAIELLPEESKP
jgi:alpha-L-fucosidase 2